MTATSRLPISPLYLKSPENFLTGDLGEWSSDAIAAWGSDKYIYLKESRINSNDGERIDAYILNQYGEILDFYEAIAEGSAGTSLKHIRISGIEENKLYFSYMTNVWSGFSSPSLKISSIELTNFENDEIFSRNVVGYASFGVDYISYSISKIHDGKVFVAYNATTHVDSNNIIESVDLTSSTSEIILNSNYNINSISYSSNKLTYTFNDSHEYYLGSFQLAIYDTSTEQYLYASELSSSRIWTPSSTTLQDGKVAVVYAKFLGNTIFGKIYNVDGSLDKEFTIDSSDGAYDPKIIATADGGFLVSFIYTDGAVGRGQYYRDQVIVRYDKNGNQVSGTLREVTGDYYKASTLAVDQDGGVIGISGDESGISVTTRLGPRSVFLDTRDDIWVHDEVFEEVEPVFL